MLHRLPEKAVDAGLVALPLRLEPGQDVGIHANRQRLLYRPVELSSNSIAPIGDFRNIGKINILVFHPHQCRDLFILILPGLTLRRLPHKLSFP